MLLMLGTGRQFILFLDMKCHKLDDISRDEKQLPCYQNYQKYYVKKR